MDEWTLTRLHFFSFCMLLPFCNDDKNDIGPTRQQEGKAAMRKAVKKLNEKNESEKKSSFFSSDGSESLFT